MFENQYVSKLLERDLYYITKRNCHKYCNFKHLWDKEHALLLSLEDLGLMGEQQGYPNKKRMELEITANWVMPDESTIIGQMHHAAGRKIQLRTVMIHENHYLRGDPSQIEFYNVY